MRSESRYFFLLPPIILVIVWGIFVSLFVDAHFGPMEGVGDIAGWEYSGFYLWENLKFTPLPTLPLFLNDTYYPFGLTQVFQSWGLEKDLLFALLYSEFGSGPWLHIYFCLGLLCQSFGIFLLSKKTFGRYPAFLVAVLIPYLSYYTLAKYPFHFGICNTHWAVLGVLTDFLILRNFVIKNRIDLNLILARSYFLVLSLGLELAYVNGLSLTSFSIHFCILAFLIVRQWRGQMRGLWRLQKESWLQDFRTKPLFYGFAVFGLLVLAFLYVPLVLQIFFESQKHFEPGINGGNYWAKPSRLLLPMFSLFNPNNAESWGARFKDSPEGMFAGSVGWFLIGLAIWGFLKTKKNERIGYFGIFLLFIFCLAHHGDSFPILSIFPWFKYARVVPRLTVIYPMILGCFALVGFYQFERKSKKDLFTLLVLGGLLTAELYFIFPIYFSRPPMTAVTQSFKKHMEVISELPGEALFDWPFSVEPGGPAPARSLVSLFALRKWHHKKTMGGYFARNTKKAMHSYLDSGLEELLNTQGQRCLDIEEVRFLRMYYEAYNFVGLNIYLDGLPKNKNCELGFMEFFPKEISRVEVSHLGRILLVQPDGSRLISGKIPTSIVKIRRLRNSLRQIWSENKFQKFVLAEGAPSKEELKYYLGSDELALIEIEPKSGACRISSTKKEQMQDPPEKSPFEIQCD